jgi:hypothetical protein
VSSELGTDSSGSAFFTYCSTRALACLATSRVTALPYDRFIPDAPPAPLYPSSAKAEPPSTAVVEAACRTRTSDGAWRAVPAPPTRIRAR